MSASAAQTVVELRAYLRKPRRTPVPAFDAFLADVESFAKLRVEAEEQQRTKARHRTKNKRGALPLDWSDIARILNPVTETPEESLVTQVVRECLNEVEQVVRDLRKVLVRERQSVPLGRVQQVDAHCLRWLARQPGRDAAEKAGGRQRILAVVRRENYDTLENRVFKDFVSRLENPCREYLRRNECVFREWDVVNKVRRMSALCAEAQEFPALMDVRDVIDLPYPNYVLRQERRYSKIWKAYCNMIRHATIAERLWMQRDELTETLIRLMDEVSSQTAPCARFHSSLWFPNIDGKKALVEAPYYEMQDGIDVAPIRDVCCDENDDYFLDLNRPPRDLLIYPSNHPNAKPYLQNNSKPSTEDSGGPDCHFLNAILDVPDAEKLHDYFEQLYALVGGKRWIILVPDDWDARRQETVIRAVPLPRQNVFLLWRSVAALIGGMETLRDVKAGASVAIADIRSGNGVMLSRLTLAEETVGQRLMPQRKAFVRHPECYQTIKASSRNQIHFRDRFLFGIEEDLYLSPKEQLKYDAFVFKDTYRLVVADHPEWLLRGAQIFFEKHDTGQIAYFDELEALSVIVQTPDECVKARTLIAADEQFPGGRERSLTVPCSAFITEQEQSVLFLLCMGNADPDAPLKQLRHELSERVEQKTSLDMTARMTPGQGMAVVTVTTGSWREPVTLDFLRNMTDSPCTIASLEKDMRRSFPPDMPHVWADNALWNGVFHLASEYLSSTREPDGAWFAKAAWIYPHGTPLPRNVSPLERLRRKNVFGNAPDRRLPSYGELFGAFNFPALFKKLARDYNRETDPYKKEQLARLIAWTYQQDVDDFKTIRKQCVKRVLEYARHGGSAPLYQELTLCANLCVEAGEWTDLLNAVFYRISDYRNNVARDFYLLYNLLQFHTSIISRLKNKDSCWLLVQHIPHWLDKHRQGGVATGYILKSLLYFLRCRLYDGKKFLTQEHDSKHYQIISECLKRPVHRNVEHVRETVLHYLNGEGRIDDLLSAVALTE